MLVKLVICLLLIFLAQSQPLTVTWNGTNITGRPTLIYHDEVTAIYYRPPPTLRNPNGPGGLLCNSTVGPIAWWPGNGLTNPPFDTNVPGILIYQIIPSGNLAAQIVNDGRNVDVSRSPYHNGLFTCRRDGNISTAVPVGFYARRLGVVRITGVRIISSSFMAASPSFTLAGDTEEGPPENYTWTRNGAPITNGRSFSISIGVNGVTDPSAYDNSCYRSTLTVTGRLPGVYQYSVSNRATPNTLTSNINIEGSAPTNLTAQQNGIYSVLVSWIAPSPPPSMGYRIRIDSIEFSADINITSSATSRTIPLQPGVHRIRLRAPSLHYPSDEVVSVTVTVKDFVMPTVTFSSLTATSVTINWSQPEGSLATDDYTISLQRLTGNNRQLCPTITDNKQMTTTTTSMNFTNLQEFSIYTVTVTARALDVLRTSTHEITTLSAAPTGFPQRITPSVTARSVSVSWNEIECIERNGRIYIYTVEFSSLRRTVWWNRFTASGLTPFTNYTFRVAGFSNRNGMGPFSNVTTIQTAEDIPGPVSNLRSKLKFTSIEITWDPPQIPNGIISHYEVIYTINNSAPVTNDTSDMNAAFIIVALNPDTRVSILVSAYTSVGQGEIAHLNYLTTLSKPSMVMNVQVENIDDTLVVIFWDRINITEITNYTVYYSIIGGTKNELSITVPSSQISVAIGNLRSDVAYLFQVAAIAQEGSRIIMGTRSVITPSSTKSRIPLPTCNTHPGPGEMHGKDIAISVVVTFFLTAILSTISFAVFCSCKKSKKIIKSLEHTPDEVASVGAGNKMDQTLCVAYAHVRSEQERRDFVPSADTEEVYAQPKKI